MAFESISFTFRFAVILVQWWRFEKQFPMYPVIGIAKQLVQNSVKWLDARIDLSKLEDVHLTRVLDITPPPTESLALWTKDLYKFGFPFSTMTFEHLGLPHDAVLAAKSSRRDDRSRVGISM